MDDDDDLEVSTALPAVRLKALDVAIVVCDGISSLFASIESIFDDLTRMLAMHSNWKLEREKVAREMYESIERIISE